MAFVSLGGDLPAVEVSVDFANNPSSSTRTWTDITPQVRRFETERGRQHELARAEAGVARLLLDNRDRRFDPTYSGALANLFTNPSLETADTGWSNGTRSNGWAKYGSWSYRKLQTVTNNDVSVWSPYVAVAAGETLAASIVANVVQDVASGIQLRIEWWDDTSSLADTTAAAQTGTGEKTLTHSGVAPASTTRARLRVFAVTSGTQTVEFYIDGAAAITGATSATYADGDQDNCRWSGTAHASTSYRGGPYYPNVLPMRRLRIRAQWNSVTYDVYQGYVEAWPLAWPDDGFNATVEVEAVDALKALNLFDLVGKSYSAELSGTRMGTVLSDAGFGTADRNLETGLSTIVASGTLTSTGANEHLQQVAESENGVLFVDRGGTVTFQDRHHRIKYEGTAAGTIGDGAGEIGYREITTSYDDTQIWNVIRVTPSGGTTEEAIDASSTASYYQRTLPSDILVSSQTEARNCAYWRLARFKDPALRIPEVSPVGAALPSVAWPVLLSLEISKRLNVRRRPSVGGSIDQAEHVEMISHRVDFERHWDTDLRLSPASSEAFWVLGHTSNSVLGTTTRLVY